MTSGLPGTKVGMVSIWKYNTDAEVQDKAWKKSSGIHKNPPAAMVSLPILMIKSLEIQTSGVTELCHCDLEGQALKFDWDYY